jgi:hypothetical protein
MQAEHDAQPATEIQSDVQEVWRQLRAFGRVTDPDLVRRLDEYVRRTQESIVRRHGVLNVAVDLVREGRDEE